MGDGARPADRAVDRIPAKCTADGDIVIWSSSVSTWVKKDWACRVLELQAAFTPPDSRI